MGGGDVSGEGATERIAHALHGIANGAWRAELLGEQLRDALLIEDVAVEQRADELNVGLVGSAFRVKLMHPSEYAVHRIEILIRSKVAHVVADELFERLRRADSYESLVRCFRLKIRSSSGAARRKGQRGAIQRGTDGAHGL